MSQDTRNAKEKISHGIRASLICSGLLFIGLGLGRMSREAEVSDVKEYKKLLVQCLDVAEKATSKLAGIEVDHSKCLCFTNTTVP